ncbi:MAG: hypothetical protein R2877_02245 [Bdellovibrionota bacterium]
MFFSRGLIMEKLNQLTNAGKVFEDYLKRYGRKNATGIEAIYRLARVQRRLGKVDESNANLGLRGSCIEKNSAAVQLRANYASKAMFELAEMKFKEYRSIRL